MGSQSDGCARGLVCSCAAAVDAASIVVVDWVADSSATVLLGASALSPCACVLPSVV